MNEVRKVFKEEMEVQMEQETNADRIRDIEADALSAVNDDEQDESNADLIDFKPSQVNKIFVEEQNYIFLHSSENHDAQQARTQEI